MLIGFFRKNPLSTYSGIESSSRPRKSGNASIELWQFDSNTWTGGIYGTVSTVNGASSDSYITLTGALTGATFYSDRQTIVTLRDYANQGAAWVKRWYAPICDPDGTHDPASTVGSKWGGL